MYIHKIILIFFIISVVNLLPLKAEEQYSHTLYYLKAGASLTPGDSDILPTFGLGMRVQNHYSGFDLSVNAGSLVFINYVSFKSLFLLYPQPLAKNQIYYGIGPSIGYGCNSVPLGGALGAATHQHVMTTLEGIVGYEFRHCEHFKTFIQLEISQPILHLGKSRYFSYMPGIALMAGLGF